MNAHPQNFPTIIPSGEVVPNAARCGHVKEVANLVMRWNDHTGRGPQWHIPDAVWEHKNYLAQPMLCEAQFYG